jgi:hypothetical protein
MKLSDMTPEQQEQKRQYDREAKQRSRAKVRAEHMRCMIPLARNYKIPEEQQKKLSQYSHAVAQTVAADLGLEKLPGTDEYIVDAVACVLCGLENNFTQIVHDPCGMLVGGWYPDAAASEAVEYVHRSPGLLRSQTFQDFYRNFLQAVLKWSRKHEQYSTANFIQDLKAEIAGTYTLPPPQPEPQPEPEKIQEPPSVPSDGEILDQGRTRLLGQLSVQDPNVPPDARRYLDGTL